MSQLCTRDDLRVEVIANSYVDDNGQPTWEEVIETGGISDGYKPYFCVGPHDNHADADFDFTTWEEALAHVTN